MEIISFLKEGTWMVLSLVFFSSTASAKIQKVKVVWHVWYFEVFSYKK